MGKERIELGLETTDLVQNAIIAQEALGGIGQELQSISGIMIKFNKDTQDTVKNISGFTATGQKFRVALREDEEGVRALTASITGLKLQTKEATDEILRLERSSKRFGTGIVKKVGTGGSPEEQGRFNAALRDTQKLIENGSNSSRQLNKIFKDLSEGKVPRYKAELEEAHKVMLRLFQAGKNLGTSHRKIAVEAKKVRDEITKGRKERALSNILAKKSSELAEHEEKLVRATVSQKQRYVQVINAASAAIAKTNVKNRQIKKIWTEIVNGDVRRYQGTLAEVQRQLIAVNQAHQRLGTEGVKHTNSLLISWQSLFRLFSIQVFHQFISSVTNGLREAATEAVALQIAIAEIQTIDTGTVAFQEWAVVLREVSDRFGSNLADVAEGAYQSLSNQVIDTTNDFKLFGVEVEKFALATKGDFSTAVNAITGILNAFQKDVGEAEEVAAKLFKTIELGRLRIADLENIGNIAILAKQLNVELEDLLASYATLTIQGVKATEASTQLRGILIKLIKPTGEMTKLFKEIGVESGEAAIATFGYANFLRILQEKTRGSTTELGKYINRIRGISGALAFTGKGFEILQENIEQISDGMFSYQEAVDLVMDNTGKRLEIALNQLRNIFTVDIMTPLLVSLGRATNEFKDLVVAMNVASVIAKNIWAPAIATVVSGLIIYAKSLSLVTGKMRILSLLNPWTAAIIGIGAVVSAIQELRATSQNAIDTANEQIRETQRAVDEIRQVNVKATAVAFENYRSFLQDAHSETLRALASVSSAANLEIATHKKEATKLITELAKLQKLSVDDFKANAKEAKRAFEEVTRAIERGKNAVKDLEATGAQIEFQFKIESLEESQAKAKLTSERIQELIAQATKVVDQDELTKIQGEILSLNQQRESLLKIVAEEEGLTRSIEESLKVHRDIIKQIADEHERINKLQKESEEGLRKESEIADKNLAIQSKIRDTIHNLEKEVKGINFEEAFDVSDVGIRGAQKALDAIQSALLRTGSNDDFQKNLRERGKLQDELSKQVIAVTESNFAGEEALLAKLAKEYTEFYRLKLSLVAAGSKEEAAILEERNKRNLILIEQHNRVVGSQDARRIAIEVKANTEKLNFENKLRIAQIKRAQDEQKALVTFIDKTEDLTRNVFINLDESEKAAKQLRSVRRDITRNPFAKLFGVGQEPEKDEATLGVLKNFFIDKSLREKDVTQISGKALEDTLRQLRQLLAGGGLPEDKDGLESIRSLLISLTKAAKTPRELKGESSETVAFRLSLDELLKSVNSILRSGRTLESFQTQIKNQQKIIENLVGSAGAEQIFKSSVTNFGDAVDLYNDTTKELQDFLRNNAPRDSTQQVSFRTQSFAPQTRIIPTTGEVANNLDFGGVEININESETPVATARAVMAQFQRLSRQGIDVFA